MIGMTIHVGGGIKENVKSGTVDLSTGVVIVADRIIPSTSVIKGKLKQRVLTTRTKVTHQKVEGNVREDDPGYVVQLSTVNKVR